MTTVSDVSGQDKEKRAKAQSKQPTKKKGDSKWPDARKDAAAVTLAARNIVIRPTQMNSYIMDKRTVVDGAATALDKIENAPPYKIHALENAFVRPRTKYGKQKFQYGKYGRRARKSRGRRALSHRRTLHAIDWNTTEKS